MTMTARQKMEEYYDKLVREGKDKPGLGAFFGDKDYRDLVIAAMAEDAEEDRLRRWSFYWNPVDQQGCYIGCLARGDFDQDGRSPHEKVGAKFGIPHKVALMLDNAFEDTCSACDRNELVLRSLSAISPGADLTGPQFTRWHHGSLYPRTGPWGDILIDRLSWAPLVQKEEAK